MTEKTETWFDELSPEHEKLLRALRHLILSASDEVREELKWGQPCYSINKLFCYLQKAKKACNYRISARCRP